MLHEKVKLSQKQADGYVIPLGTLNLVLAVTETGLVGCGAFDVAALDNFNYPAVRVRSVTGKPIATIDDLLRGVVREANKAAIERGVKVGMKGKEALELI